MAFVKIENGVVVQKQPYFEADFIEAPDSVLCGMIVDGQGGYQAPERPIETRRAARCQQLESDLHHYIFDVHDYPVPTQITLQALYADPDSSPPARAACKQIFDWVKSVLGYYYGIKAQVLAAGNPDEITWDFAVACDAAAPGLSLAQVMQLAQSN